jgi:Domain of unknown function (DUF4276)
VGKKSDRWPSLSRVLLLAEGFTEERFVKNVLAPHLVNYGVYLIPTVVNTKVLVSGERRKGGGDFGKLESNLHGLLGDSGAIAITMFYDYYAFPANFPQKFPAPNLADGLGAKGADSLESALATYFNDTRFKPFVHLHEFEAFMFVDAGITAAILLNRGLAKSILNERAGFENAEAINDGVNTAPSKRIMRLAPAFQKTLQGVIIAEKTGLPALRADCPRFSAWVAWLESLGNIKSVS